MGRVLKELSLLIPGSIVAGYLVATIQHFVLFGAMGGGFDRAALWLACFEGGLLGAILGLPTGLLVFYLAFWRRVTSRRVVITVLGGLFVGCLVGLIGERVNDGFIVLSALTTPCLTFVIALVVGRISANSSRRVKLSRP
ncbi:MAG: hypothetical protein WB817_20535 [Terriglobales bacterium]